MDVPDQIMDNITESMTASRKAGWVDFFNPSYPGSRTRYVRLFTARLFSFPGLQINWDTAMHILIVIALRSDIGLHCYHVVYYVECRKTTE